MQMITPAKLLTCVSALALFSSPALASDGGNFGKNSQSNWAQTRAELNAGLIGVTGDVTLTAAAISNSFNADLSGDTVINNTQHAGYGHRVSTTSELNVYPDDALQSLSATSAAITNSASIKVVDESAETWVNNKQYANADTFTQLNATLQGVKGDTELTAAALSNSVHIQGEQPVGLNNRQLSYGATTADLNLHQEGYLHGDLTATAAAIGNSASIEWEYGDVSAGLHNRQHLSGDVYSELELYGHDGIGGSVDATNAAIANTLSVKGTGDYHGYNHQTFRGDVRASTTIILDDVAEDVSVTTAAIGNSASFEFSDAGHVSIENWQRANIDPTATAYVELDSVGGDVDVTTAAIANALSVSTLPDVAGLNVDSRQENNAYTAAITTVDLANITGDVVLSSVAVGNSVNISNLPN